MRLNLNVLIASWTGLDVGSLEMVQPRISIKADPGKSYRIDICVNERGN